MPLYEYTCRDCGHQFEKLVIVVPDGWEPPPCPTCGGVADQEISESVLRFYGRGWTKPNVNKRGEGIGTERAPETDAVP